ncbi:MAG TPA: amidohydrolase family protein, partial [Arenibaculum sp.]|nr:amidohydrolase family protein [Arenibaculum sp.]
GLLLDERLTTAVGVKSIAAYRIGLDFEPGRPDDAETDKALTRWAKQAQESGSIRLADATIIRFCLWEAVDRGVPLQFHIGYGDPDVDLHRCNPLLLTEFLRRTRDSGARILLLHCYPFHRDAGYLAQVFEHVYCDVGLAVNYTGVRSSHVIAESLELTPFHKALFSSDAFGAAELFHLGALQFRHGLALALDQWHTADGWPEAEQRRIARLIGSENALRVYGLDKVPHADTRPSA